MHDSVEFSALVLPRDPHRARRGRRGSSTPSPLQGKYPAFLVTRGIRQPPKRGSGSATWRATAPLHLLLIGRVALRIDAVERHKTQCCGRDRQFKSLRGEGYRPQELRGV